MIAATEISDAELVLSARAGDASAFRVLCDRYRPELRALGRRWFGDGWLAEEAAQEALLQAWRSLDELRDPALFGPWLFRIARRWCHHRALARATEWLPTDQIEALTAPAADPAVMVAARFEVEALLAGLPASQREVVELCLIAGLSVPEAAERLAVEPCVVKGRLQRARQTLRREGMKHERDR
ncbi:MAG: RNA polymerase sigma factor [Armatimonadetes bacterium]|nr:RNA polymerase sigma factor [Armatimonadota bacterium]